MIHPFHRQRVNIVITVMQLTLYALYLLSHIQYYRKILMAKEISKTVKIYHILVKSTAECIVVQKTSNDRKQSTHCSNGIFG